MKTLNQIIGKLKLGEQQFIRKFYNAQPNGEDKKRLKLFEMILSNTGEPLTDVEACKAIYGTPPNSAFSHLKTRLKKDMMDYLLLQDPSKHYKSKRLQASMKVTKSLLQGELLLGRGIYNEAEKILTKALALAEHYEFFPEILRIRGLLRKTMGFRKGVEAFEFYNKPVAHYLKEYKKTLKALEFLFHIDLPNHFNTNFNIKDILEKGSHQIDALEGMYQQEGTSLSFQLHYFQARITYHNLERNFESSLSFGEKLLSLVSENEPYKSVGSYFAGVSMVVSGIHLNLKNYEQSIEHSKEALNIFRKGLTNELRALDGLFFAYYRNKDYEKAVETVNRAQKHKQLKSNVLLPARWDYFQACLEYEMGAEEKAYEKLRRNNAIAKDKSGWLIGFKILEMMKAIDQKEEIVLDYFLTNFNRLLNRNKQQNIARAQLISSIIRSLLSFRMDFKQTYMKNKEKLKQLEEGLGNYFWDPAGYEIVRFDEWFVKKMN